LRTRLFQLVNGDRFLAPKIGGENVDEKDTSSTDEIEVTPEMARAGADIMLSFDEGWDSPTEVASKIFKAMLRRSPKTNS